MERRPRLFPQRQNLERSLAFVLRSAEKPEGVGLGRLKLWLQDGGPRQDIRLERLRNPGRSVFQESLTVSIALEEEGIKPAQIWIPGIFPPFRIHNQGVHTGPRHPDIGWHFQMKS
jgi:hypothetical protein